MRLVGLLVLLSACGHGRARESGSGPGPTRIAVFPVDSDTAEPGDSFAAAMESALAREGLEVTGAAAVEPALARNRIRGRGIDREDARAAREELGVEAVLLLGIERYLTTGEPKLTVTGRLVTVSDPPLVLWMDGFSRAASTTHGFLGLGGFTSMAEMERAAAARLARSLSDFTHVGLQQGRCGSGGPFRPKRFYRGESRLPGRRVAVLPFMNRTSNRRAGDEVSLHVVRQLAAVGGFDVVEPGAVREALRMERIVTRGGVSIAEAERVAKLLAADLVISGEVTAYDDTTIPLSEFSTLVIDRNDELVWQSRSRNTGEDAVRAFDLGRLGTLGEVTCRMAASVVAGVLAGEPRT